MTKIAHHASRLAALAGLTFILAAPAEAGPPLLCQMFEPGPGAALLPWDEPAHGWNAPSPSYDRSQLVRDTLSLLTPDAPILARMENLRRATLYAARDRGLAAELQAALMARARSSQASTSERALALFDAGILLESYSQANQILKWGMLSGEARGTWALDREPAEDGYALVRQAMTLAGSTPEMEYAASLMTTGTAAAEHRRRAASAAAPGTVLARHLSR